ncbi:MAG: glycerol-3-phosphate dehydrogenase/oxidase [Caldilineaceae bacterium SB0665_bin_21]|nr:glycerol-3-phosphate dehydrogenase/oxidase [Caldilineaceae bacterium SB0665_bin_21]
MNRDTALGKLAARTRFDVLVIGAGVNGAGVFRDLAAQGLSILLVDKGDFGSGTSAASSHLAHGGIRYLEYGEFRLVREAVQERNRLLSNAGHLVKPLPTAMPLRTRGSGLLNAPLRFLRLQDRASPRGAWVVRIGLAFYSLFSNTVDNDLPGHKVLNRTNVGRLLPHLTTELKACALYHDALILHPERLIWELVAEGMQRSRQCLALNYVSVAGMSDAQVELRDEATGRELVVEPRIVVNAAGPWIDRVNGNLGQASRLIGGTKGSHLVLDHPNLFAALGGHMIFFEADDGRIVLICPFHDRVLLGTTDIRTDDPDADQCTPEEEAYLLGLVPQMFPGIQMDAQHVVYRYCGVRPLGRGEGETGQISRDHSLYLHRGTGSVPPVLSLVGGKWTTFRAFAEQASDRVLGELGRKRTSATGDTPIGGGENLPRTKADRERAIRDATLDGRLKPADAEALYGRYGTTAVAVAKACSPPDMDERLSGSRYLAGEVAYICRTEMVACLSDIVQRRTLMAMLGEATPELLEAVARMAAPILGWSEDRRQREIKETTHILARRHGVNLP